jgi:PIN like domain
LSDEQPKSVVLFLDRTHGNLIYEKLPSFGFEVKACKRIFPNTMPDVEWIAECAKENWVILSGDKRIAEVPAERQAVIDGKCKVFMFEDTNSKSEEWLATVLVGRQRIMHLVQNADGPFFVTIRKFGHSHFSLPHFIPSTGAGWKPEGDHLKVEEPQPQKKQKSRSQQRKFWEDETA